MSEPICTCDFVGDPKCKAHYRSERTYTESELAAERAALLREAAEACRQALPLGAPKHAEQAIVAIPTDQSALARVEAAARRVEIELVWKAWARPMVTVTNDPCQFDREFDDWLKKRLAALQDRGQEAEK